MHPVQSTVVAKLRKCFSHVALFFWNGCRGDELYIVWRPKVFLPHGFSLLQTRYKMDLSLWKSAEDEKSKKENFMVLNVPEILCEMIVAGDHLLRAEKIS